MAQVITGIRSILNHPLIYSFSQICLGANKGRRKYVQEYIRPADNNKILDIGCGTADILEFLPSSIEYFGFDLNKDYIDYAKRKFGSRGMFICSDVNRDITNLPKFDIILATGILHHLNDDEVEKLFNMAAFSLKENGRLITLDCCYIENQSKLAKFIISKDRGQNVRSPEGYRNFGLKHFNQIKSDIRHNLSRIPYTHFIMECSNSIS